MIISPHLRQLEESLDEYKNRLVLNKDEFRLSWNDIAQLWFDHTGDRKSDDYFRKYRKRLNKSDITKPKIAEHKVENTYKDTVEINKDGSQSSNKLIRMTIAESKDPSYLLKAHGYSIDEWELISAKSKVWNAYSTQDGIMQMYASSISVKPKTTGFSMDKLLEEIKKVPSFNITNEKTNIKEKCLLTIPFFDTHFGISDYDYYMQTQLDTFDLIEKRNWGQILFIIGQDLFHNDNFRSQTSSGTIIDKVDMVKAWSDALKFYKPLIERALKHSNGVKVVFSKGNHDESMGWAFVQLLKAYFPQVEFDDEFVERKCHKFEKVFIGITHGDKARKNLHNLFPVEFPLEWANASVREILSGHLHREESIDHFGMTVRTLATRNRTDNWHKDNGFVGANKRFMLFEYTEDALKSIHYV